MTPDSIPRGKEPSGTRVKGKMILSDDEPDEPPVKPSKRRKSNMGYKSEGSPAMDSEAEKEGRALMDIDDGIFFCFAFVICNILFISLLPIQIKLRGYLMHLQQS